MGFNNCCPNSHFVQFSLDHNPKPKNWEKVVLDAIQMLLWYIPNINSKQSQKNSLIKDKTYENLTFSYILDSLNMSEQDYIFLDNNQQINDDIWDFYHNEICINCQKIIIVKGKDKTKTEDLLRCIRNCVAHGDFTVINDMLIGFNDYKGKKKAIVKIKPQKLLDVLKFISSPLDYNKINLLYNILARKGFKLYTEYPIKYDNRIIRADFLAIKNGQKFLFEFKNAPTNNHIHQKQIQFILKQLSSYELAITNQNIKLVLVIDNASLTTASKQYANQQESLIVLDANKLMLLPYIEEKLDI